ncbi:probable cytochrome P450 6a17 [Cylas formicarius]|uniref:probable cytochrome P450 6a17 n=1 Tax=Cylas formicarius TaxID=197179 RepID=UPI0029589D87|nr:probable cytochrome P450 6a17 [Cylas formicarius]
MLVICCVLVVLVTSLLYWEKRAHSYWTRRGIAQLQPGWFFGNIKDLLLERTSSAEFARQLYWEMKNKGVKLMGIYSFYDPILVVRDLDLTKRILIKDFEHFSSRGTFCNEKVERHAGHVANVTGERWRRLRKALTPAFTPSKMKHIFDSILSCTPGLVEKLDIFASARLPADMKDIFDRFTTSVLGSALFGLEPNTMSQLDSDIRRYGSKMAERGIWNSVMRILVPKLPTFVVSWLGLRLSNKEAVDFFWDLTRRNIEQRRTNDVDRNDFLQTLLKMTTADVIFTENDAISQTLLFYGAGFEVSSCVANFTLLELASNQSIQDRLRREIEEAVGNHDGRITYDAIQDISCLDNVIYEGMRKHATTTILARKCEKTYTVPDTEHVIEKGTLVWLPVAGYYDDREYYPDPHVYNPSRFDNDNHVNRSDEAFWPFGDGPRQCIGIRFGMLQTKIGLVAIVKNFRVTLNDKTTIPVVHAKGKFFPSPSGGVWLDFEKICESV